MIKPEIIKFCSFCNDRFIASRSTATFCSNTCRTKACVKRKQDDQVKADQEAQRLQEQDRLRQIADEKRLKREEKAKLKRQEQEEIDESARKSEANKKIQDEIDAFETTEKNRHINSIVEMILVKAKAKERQLQVDEARKKNDVRIRIEKERKKVKEQGEMIGKGIAELIKNISNLNNYAGNTLTQPGPIITPTLPAEPEIPSHLGQIISPVLATKPVHKSIVEDILDQLNIF